MKGELTENARRIRAMVKANDFAAFYRDLQTAIKSQALIRAGSVVVQQSESYSRNIEVGGWFTARTVPNFGPGKPKLWVATL